MASEDAQDFNKFLTEVKYIEKRDSVLTNKQQIDRILRPGSKFFNMNPFDVLQLPLTATPTEIKKQYRKLSFLVHPDKNAEDLDRAQNAFDAVVNAYRTLEDKVEREKVMQVIEGAKELAEQKLKEKRKQAKKERKDSIEEDDPEKYEHFLKCMIAKLFADMEMKKKHLEKREFEERKRKQEEEEAEDAKKKKEEEWKKQWEESRTDRVDTWRNFQSGGKKKKKIKGFNTMRPPGLKPEKRE
ncbi:dnaJ homolog subfamily C member 8-like [Corticium candelabrum]|uniref:dnaJ homolog subfamily C member 8-like n=1 Tax=Corticium candelabrum TaxID=121492 RepID=UPI002E264A8A|nr:dnaJ homolog subfamily C member 8-like [Corticium candelabrum]